jgi:hypothetical protein
MWQPPRQYIDDQLAVGDQKVAEMLAANIIFEVPTTARHASAVTLPMKRAPDGSWTDHRFAIDLRHVNQNTVVDRYGVPLPEDLFRRMRGARFLTKLDMRAGFFQVTLDLPSKLHTTFHWRGRCYAYHRLPFGHVNATGIFQRRMELELQAAGLQQNAVVFVDDIMVFSDTMAEHTQQLRQLLQHFQRVGLRAHPAKTIVAADCMPYLGHLVTATELKPDPAKVAAMQALLQPNSVKRLQAHLGLFNYYRCYVPGFARIAQPLYMLLRKGAHFVWQDEHQRAYEQLKAALSTPGLALQQPDPALPFRLYTDWSSTGIAAVLNQQDEQGQERLVACVSRSLNQAERNYPAWKGELLAAVYGIKAFRPYLLAREFQLLTDHKALLWMLSQKEPTGQLARWLMSISEYLFTVVHRAGIDNPADTPSREPQACAADWTGSRLDTGQQQRLLPAVYLPDGTPDPHVYSHAELAAYVGKPAGPQPVAAAAQTAGTAGGWHQPMRPSAILAELAAEAAPQYLAVQQDTLCALAAISAAAGAGIDQYDPAASTASSLLRGSTAATLLRQQQEAAVVPGASTEHQRLCQVAQVWPAPVLQQAAAEWVARACRVDVPPPARAAAGAPFPGSYQGTPDALGIKSTLQISTVPVASTFYPAALQDGIVLLELCGGMSAGLEATLRAGFVVQQYLYCDTDPKAQAVAAHRVWQLQQQYPAQLSAQALAGAFTALPADIRQVESRHLAAAARQATARQWLVVAGWPCQDFSMAGPSVGLAGRRAQLIYELVRIVGTLQQLQPHLPPAYLLENVAFQLHGTQRISHGDFQQVCSVIGHPVLLDAAQFGSLAHRLRNWWTNMVHPKQLAGAAYQVIRPPGRSVQLVLPPHRTACPVYQGDQPPYYLCNQVGQTRSAWPTLMSRHSSYAFRPQQPGSVLDSSGPGKPCWDEPTAVEREVSMGFLPGSTAAEGLTGRGRCALLGQAMDANTLQGILAIAEAWWRHTTPLHHQVALGRAQTGVACAAGVAPAAAVTVEAGRLPQQQARAGAATGHSPAAAAHACRQQQSQSGGGVTGSGLGTLPGYPMMHALYTAAAAQEALAAGGGSTEVWLDHPTLSTLQQGQLPPGCSSKERDRVQQRLKLYAWDARQQQLMRRHADGSMRVVPAPAQRLQLIEQQHQLCGHYGVRRTAALLATKYWWRGMLADTAQCVSRCEHCSRVNASFSRLGNREELQSVPLSSLGFRWHADLAGPFPVSKRGSRYVLVAVEAFSKWLEAVPIPDKEPTTVAYAFLHNVLARYAAPGQVVSDNGPEFTEGAFAQLLLDCFVDHCTTSVAHPQANGQAEKAVDVVKRALRKMCLQRHSLEDWDSDVAWLTLGYRCSPHSSTGFAPYELLFARQPVVPPAIRSGMQQPLQFDVPAAAAVDLLQRQQLVRRLCPVALSNLSIAQHRDQRRYALVRSAGFAPRMYRFQAGDYVYLRQQQRHSTLQPKARPSILRVKQVLPSGILQLQGKCGRTAEVHMDHCAPCHLPHLGGDIDPLLVDDVEHIVCEACGREEPESHLLLCDVCNAGWHTFCLQPPLDQVPQGSWLCPGCLEEGYTAADAAAREQQRERLQEQAARPVLYPAADMRRRDQAAAVLDGRLVVRSFVDPSTGRSRNFWGRVVFRGEQSRPRYFYVVYEDGDSHTASTAMLRKWLMPADTTLPAGVAIPVQATQGAAAPVQQQ